MISLVPSGQVLGATVSGVDLKQSLSQENFSVILRGLGKHGVLRFPGQLIEPREIKQLAERFGQPQVMSASKYFEPGIPEVLILSNVKKNGVPIGKSDAGQFWHTDMTYNRIVGFVNVMVAHAVPQRDGRPLGATEFTNTQAAYDDLPEELKTRLANANAIHDLNKSWQAQADKGSRAPLTEAQRRERPPTPHPVFLTHPITGRKLIFVNPSHVVKIDGMSEAESDQTLSQIYEHVLKPKYRYTHHWTVGDVLLWDHIGTWHNAIADYGPDEHRTMKICQVLADQIFDPKFLEAALPTQ